MRMELACFCKISQHCWLSHDANQQNRIALKYMYRVRINYRRILQNHIFTNTEQKYMMLLPFERGPGVPKLTPAISMGWSCSGHRQHLLHLATPVTRPNSVWFLLVGFRQEQCLHPTTSKDTTRIARAYQHRNRERHARHAWEGLASSAEIKERVQLYLY